MRLFTSTLLIVVVVMSSLSSVALAQSSAATPAVLSAAPGDKDSPGRGDNLRHPLGEKQRDLRERALAAKLKGKGSGKVVQVARGQYVELAREGEDSILTVLGEFGTQIHPTFGGTPGPLHNQIPQPDRSQDNTTIWVPDFSQTYYGDLLYSKERGANSMANYYVEQSSGRYSVNGAVTDWVMVPYNEARYGTNACGDIVCSTVWSFVRDSLNAWYASQVGAGKTAAQIDAELARFDVWDRYDYDGDGDFDEPDGYIDHFQSVHSGEGEETGGGAQGQGAIWSHRWYAFFNDIGVTGPSFNKLGGTQIGSSSYWVGDYTIEPENGGVGVFAHEFGHDLGLPDLYDTAGNTCGAACENSTGFWTLMSSGSYGNDGTEDIGSKPVHLGAWEKFQLGWLNYSVALAGQSRDFRLGPAETNTRQAQGLFVVLPDKEVETNLGPAYAGSRYYYSGQGDGIDNRMYRQVTLPPNATLAAQVRYQIELDWDYAYVVVSQDGGATWQSVATNLSTNTNPNGQNFGNGITGTSNGWVALTADLSGYTGTVLFGFRYWTDGAVVEPGISIDDISIAGGAPDGAETDGGWTFDPATGGFRVTTGIENSLHFNAYVAEYRQYRGYDASLKTGPYNFGFLNTKPNWVEHFPYQDGLLISYWDSSQLDNNTSSHPGEGLILPIDSHPAALIRADGLPWRPRIQSYDSTFGLETTDAITLHLDGQPTTHGTQRAVPIFDDSTLYWDPVTPTASVKNPNTNTQVRVKSVNAQGDFMEVQVRPAK